MTIHKLQSQKGLYIRPRPANQPRHQRYDHLCLCS